MCNGVIKLGDFGLAKRKILIENDDSSNENEDGWIESRLIPDEDQYEYEHDNGLLTKTEEHTAGCGTLRYSYLLSNPILSPPQFSINHRLCSYSAPEQKKAGGNYSEKVVRWHSTV